MTRDPALLVPALREELQRIKDEVIDWRRVQRVEDPDSQRRRFADERLADLADRLIFGDDDAPTTGDLRADEADRRYGLDREGGLL